MSDSVQRFVAVHDNLRAENQENWSNAVHSCRRILVDLADAVFPPTDEVRHSKGGSEIKLGKQHYVNRIVCFVEDHSDSRNFQAIAGSQLRFLGDRLDAVAGATQKGTHDTIVTREEADRYVVHTYLVVGDVLSLMQPDET